MELAGLRIHSGQFLPLPSPAEAMAHRYSDYEREALQDVRARTIVGTPAQVRARIEAMAQDSAADEVLIVSNIRSEEHTSELQSLMRNSYDVFCLNKKPHQQNKQ